MQIFKMRSLKSLRLSRIPLHCEQLLTEYVSWKWYRMNATGVQSTKLSFLAKEIFVKVMKSRPGFDGEGEICFQQLGKKRLVE